MPAPRKVKLIEVTPQARLAVGRMARKKKQAKYVVASEAIIAAEKTDK